MVDANAVMLETNDGTVIILLGFPAALRSVRRVRCTC